MKRLLGFLFAVAIVVAWVVPSMATEASFSGHYRVRAFAVDNVLRQGNSQTLGRDEKWSFVDHRLRLNIDLKQDDVMGRLQINSGNYKWGEVQEIDPDGDSNTDDDEWHREMWIQFPLGPVTAKVGKQLAATPFKSIMYRDVLDTLLLIYPATPELTVLGGALNADDSDTIDADVFTLIGVYKPEGLPLSGAIGWYYLVANDSAGLILSGADYIEARPHWLAGTLDYNQGPITASLTGAYKFGDADATIGTTTTSYDFNAYAIDARAGYDFEKAGGIPLSLEAIIGYGSGDDNATDNDFEAFTAPLPSYTHSAIFLDHGSAAEGGVQLSHPARTQPPLSSTWPNTQPNGLANLTWFGLKAGYKATDKATIKALLATYYLTEEKVTGGTSYSYQDDELGQELNLALVYNLAKGLDLTLSGAWFMPEERGWTQEGASTTASDDTVSEYLAKIFWSF